jgi:threonyl-tRNA synthetase
MRFSTHSKEGLGKKYIDNAKLWKKTEDMVRNVMLKEKIPFVEVKNEAAFYGPKIDVQVWSAIGREFTLATNQVDFAVPERFGLTYTDKEGQQKTPICIHRAPLGTHERTIGFLIEHYAGAFPLWLSPIQVSVIPIGEKHLPYAKEIQSKLKENNIRAELRDENETLGKKIRSAEMQKIPCLLIIGDKEIAANAVAVRERGKGDLGQVQLNDFIDKIKKDILNKK